VHAPQVHGPPAADSGAPGASRLAAIADVALGLSSRVIIAGTSRTLVREDSVVGRRARRQ
jgi:hypothetical protein